MEDLKVLVLCDDYWHPAEVIEKGLSLLSGFSFDFIHDAKDMLSVDMLSEYPVIVNAKGYEMNSGNHTAWFVEDVTEVGPAQLEAYVRAGGGLVVLHSGSSFTEEQNADYCNLIGAAFITHPTICPVSYSICADHPVTEGVHPFTVRDEQYDLKFLTDDIQRLMTSTTESAGEKTGVYVRTMGKGRIGVMTPGHVYSVFRNEDFRRLLSNMIRWAAE